jgi:hypothetical protein
MPETSLVPTASDSYRITPSLCDDLMQSFEFFFFPAVDATLLKHRRALTPLEAYFDLYKRMQADRRLQTQQQDLANDWGWGIDAVRSYQRRVCALGALQGVLQRGNIASAYTLSHADPTALWPSLDTVDSSAWRKPWTRRELGLYFGHASPDRQLRARPKELARTSGMNRQTIADALQHFEQRHWIRQIDQPEGLVRGSSPRHRIYAIQNVYPAAWFWFWAEIDRSLWYRPFTLLEQWIDLYEHCKMASPYYVSCGALGAAWACSATWAGRTLRVAKAAGRITIHQAPHGLGISLCNHLAPVSRRSGREFVLDSFPFSMFRIAPRHRKKLIERDRRWLDVVERGQAAAGQPFPLPVEQLSGEWGCRFESVDEWLRGLVDVGALKLVRKARGGGMPALYVLPAFDPTTPWFDISYWRPTPSKLRRKRYTWTQGLIDLLKRNQQEDPFDAGGIELATAWHWRVPSPYRLIDRLKQSNYLLERAASRGNKARRCSFLVKPKEAKEIVKPKKAPQRGGRPALVPPELRQSDAASARAKTLAEWCVWRDAQHGITLSRKLKDAGFVSYTDAYDRGDRTVKDYLGVLKSTAARSAAA